MNSAELAKFTARWSGDEAEVALGDACLDVADILGETAVAECDSSVLDAASLADFPKDLQIRMHSSDGFGTFLFYEMEIYKDDEGSLVSCYICHQPNKYWERRACVNTARILRSRS